MNRPFIHFLILAFSLWASLAVNGWASDKKDKENPIPVKKEKMKAGPEEGVEAALDQYFPDDDVRSVMLTYINENSQRTGTFNIKDPNSRNVRRLTLFKFHDRVTERKGVFTAKADFKDMDAAEGDENVTLKIDAKEINGLLRVIDVSMTEGMHKGSKK